MFLGMLLSLATFTFLVLAVFGLIAPRRVLWIGRRTRTRIFFTYFFLMAASFILNGQATYNEFKDRVANEAAPEPVKKSPKIQAMEKAAFAIPASDHQANIDAYTELLELDPENEFYLGKVASYIVLLGETQKARVEPDVAGTQKKKETALPPYKVINVNTMGSIKRSYDVRLEGRVSIGQLGKIGKELESKGSVKYNKTFICYYLPGMIVNAGAWATTHFDPGINRKILGFTRAQAADMAATIEVNQDETLVGAWLLAGIIHRREMIIKTKEGSFIEYSYPGESPLRKRLIEVDAGTEYAPEHTDFGEYFIINAKGNLETWDVDGIIHTAQKIGN